MQFASIRIITDDLDRLVSFYEQVTGVTAERPAPPFAEFVMPSVTLAIGHSQTVGLFGAGSARAADNHSMIIEFRVTTSTPNTHACSTSSRRGSRNQPRCRGATALFRDPDGNLVNLFTPASEEVIQRFQGR